MGQSSPTPPHAEVLAATPLQPALGTACGTQPHPLLIPLPHTGRAQSHRDTILHPSPQRVLWGTQEGDKGVSNATGNPQPPTTTASELTEIPVTQQAGTGKRAHQMEKAESAKTDFEDETKHLFLEGV